MGCGREVIRTNEAIANTININIRILLLKNLACPYAAVDYYVLYSWELPSIQ